MRKTRQILPLLVDGSYSAEALAEKTGFDLEEVRDAIRTLRRSGFVQSVIKPAEYQATIRGAEVLSKPRKSPPSLIERKLRERKAREERMRANANTMVGKAIDQQPALMRVWG